MIKVLPGLLLVAMMVSGCESGPATGGEIAGVQSGHVDVGGGTLYYETLGKGAPVILIHGGFGDRRMWNEQFAPLAQAFRVVRYDHRGFGNSPAPGEAYSAVTDLVKLMDHLQLKRANLVGNSMGGTLALDFALQQRDRTGAVVVIASTAAGYPVPEEDVKTLEAVLTAAKEKGPAAGAALWLQHPMVAMTSQHATASPLLKQMIGDNSGTLLMQHWPQERNSPPAYERLGELQANVLFIVGDHDVAAVRDGAKASAERIKGAKVETIAGADHLPQMTQPDKVNKLLVDYVSLNGC